MPFNVALTGIRAASVDLEVTGNNIANASTTGYKQSRVEFADLYANSYLGVGSSQIGDGVRVQNIRQQFNQGNITFTDNGLDLAINGNGFFVMNDTSGVRSYTRAGAFSVDKDGFVVSGSGSRLQGFPANDQGVLGGVLSNLVVDTNNLPPVRTTEIDAAFNLDATQEVLVERGESLTSDGPMVGVATTGTLNGYTAQALTLTLADGSVRSINIPANSEASAIAAEFNAINGAEASATTRATIPAATYNNSSGTMRVTLDGVPFNGFTDLTSLGNAINNSPSLVGITAILQNDNLIVSSNRGNDLRFDFNGDNRVTLDAATAATSVGASNVISGFTNPSMTLAIDLPNVTGLAPINISGGSIAGVVAAIGANQDLIDAGISAVATTTFGGGFTLVNSNPLGGRIDVRFTGNVTDSIVVNTTDGFEVLGNSAAASSVPLNSASSRATVGGAVTLILDEGSQLSSANEDVFFTLVGTPFVNNAFDPRDEGTYNHATSTTVYDSLGNPHVSTMYFVKEPRIGAGNANLWTMYVQIDGRDVGDPLVPGGDATRASYSLVFEDNGAINTVLSDEILISNWLPVDANGATNGAEGPLNIVAGGTLPIPDPPTSSNFVIDLVQATQFGGSFAVSDLTQNGFTTGRLVGLDVAETGNIFARFTNGESLVLGQVALANFNNINGLAPVGDSNWVETFNSGGPIIGAPGTAALGLVRSSSLEESNVELSEQLVNLIIAQRNYQANAKTIEAANTVTQTIINLR